MVIWIIGKSGAGKTFLAKRVYYKIKGNLKKVIWVDGDKFRKKFSSDLGFSVKDRRKNSLTIQKYWKYYEKKKYIVICSILSIFKDHQKRNRKLFNKYIQIYIKASDKRLVRRNKKKIYDKKTNVVGKDIEFPTPFNSDLVILNNFKKQFLNNVKKIESKLYAQI